MKKKEELLREIQRVREDSHSFLRYFGIFWGAILAFLVTDYKIVEHPEEVQRIPQVLSSKIVESISTLDATNLLASLLLLFGILLIFLSICLLCANASSTRIANKITLEYVREKQDILSKGVSNGLLGSTLLILLFMLLLMETNPLLADDVALLSLIFFLVMLIYVFLISPLLFLMELPTSFGRWVNFLIGLAILIFSVWIKIDSVSIPLWGVWVFLFLLFIYSIFEVFLAFKIPAHFAKLIQFLLPRIQEKSN